MSLRARIAGVAGLAVALAVVAVAVTVYIAVRADLRGQIDESLRQRAAAFALEPRGAPAGQGGAGPGNGDGHPLEQRGRLRRLSERGSARALR